MKKITLFITIILSIFLLGNNLVHAEGFYEGEYINNIWMVRKNSKRLIYQTARFLKRSSDNQFAYCVEPFTIINAQQGYTEIDPNTISPNTWERVSLLAYYGYGYGNHTDPKWYPITQIMIWKAIDPSSDFYFTDSLNGNRINIFQAEMAEIESLIQRYYTQPSFANQEFTMVKGHNKTIIDNNQVLTNYRLTNPSPYVNIHNNSIEIIANDLIETNLEFIKEENNYSIPPILYYHASSQNLMTAGKINPINTNIKIKVIETKLEVNKLDKDTNQAISQGQAHLEGSIFGIYDMNDQKIDQVIIDEKMQATFNNLDFGKYYLKEEKAGIGYLLDETIYPFEITEDNTAIHLDVTNEVIKRKIEIYKKYGNPHDKNMLPEANIQFAIYDINGELVTTIITDENGYASITLPYGKYKVKQINTTEGYQKVDDFEIDITEEDIEPLTYNLDNLEIEVPNTYSNQQTIFYGNYLIPCITGILYVKKKLYT